MGHEGGRQTLPNVGRHVLPCPTLPVAKDLLHKPIHQARTEGFKPRPWMEGQWAEQPTSRLTDRLVLRHLLPFGSLPELFFFDLKNLTMQRWWGEPNPLTGPTGFRIFIQRDVQSMYKVKGRRRETKCGDTQGRGVM